MKMIVKEVCTFTRVNEFTGKEERYMPAVNCEGNCATCGWNPAVKEKRLEKMGRQKMFNRTWNELTGMKLEAMK